MAITPVVLSGAANGRNVKVAATATAGTLIHTAHATSLDEVTLFANNTSSSDVLLTLEAGGTTSPDDRIIVTVPAQTTKLVLPSVRYTGSVALRAFAASANVINIFGTVNRHS